MQLTAWLTLATSGVLLATADMTPEPWFVRLGAMGGLLFALFYLLKVHLPGKDKMFTDSIDKLTERHDRWERLRHEDSQELTNTLNDLRANCIAVQTKLGGDHDRMD
jgi:hypothetical protein